MRFLGGTAETQPSAGKLLALVDCLRGGTLNEAQSETVGLLRARIVELAERETTRISGKDG